MFDSCGQIYFQLFTNCVENKVIPDYKKRSYPIISVLSRHYHGFDLGVPVFLHCLIIANHKNKLIANGCPAARDQTTRMEVIIFGKNNQQQLPGNADNVILSF